MAAVDRFRVVGGARLVGEVAVSGAKNSVLKLMAASLLAAGKPLFAMCLISPTSTSWPIYLPA